MILILEAANPIVTFQPGRAWEPDGVLSGIHGSVVLRDADGKDRLRIDQSGAFIVNGRRVTENREVYGAFVEWLSRVRVTIGLPATSLVAEFVPEGGR